MICQKCGEEVRNGNICPRCKSDVVLLNKVRTISLKQYNKGVYYAREGDYSAAIISLSQCVMFDKKNYVARNLLGISYYQIGMVGDALKQWIISESMKNEKNPATKYIAALQKNGRMLEKCNDAIVFYNKAIGQFKAGSDDLALIGLKKAVDFNPNFVDAYNLIAAYYVGKGDKKKARTYIDKVLEIDKRNPKALEYLADLSSENKKSDDKNTTGTGYNENAPKKIKVRWEIVTFFAGVIITGAIAAALALPGIESGFLKKIDTLEERIIQLEDENTNGTSTFALKYKQLEEENETLKAENEQYKAAEANKEQAESFQLALNYSASGENIEAAKLLKKLDVEKFEEEDKSRIEALKEKTYPFAAEYYYNEGESLFSAGNIDEAEVELKTALEYGSKENFMDDVLYLLGSISENKGDTEGAKEYYARVINEFSDSNVFEQSENRLNELLSSGA